MKLTNKPIKKSKAPVVNEEIKVKVVEVKEEKVIPTKEVELTKSEQIMVLVNKLLEDTGRDNHNVLNRSELQAILNSVLKGI